MNFVRKDAKPPRCRAGGQAALDSQRLRRPNACDANAASPQELPLGVFASLRETHFLLRKFAKTVATVTVATVFLRFRSPRCVFPFSPRRFMRRRFPCPPPLRIP